MYAHAYSASGAYSSLANWEQLLLLVTVYDRVMNETTCAGYCPGVYHSVEAAGHQSNE